MTGPSQAHTLFNSSVSRLLKQHFYPSEHSPVNIGQSWLLLLTLFQGPCRSLQNPLIDYTTDFWVGKTIQLLFNQIKHNFTITTAFSNPSTSYSGTGRESLVLSEPHSASLHGQSSSLTCSLSPGASQRSYKFKSPKVPNGQPGCSVHPGVQASVHAAP